MHDEGYVIVPDGAHGLAVIAETAGRDLLWRADGKAIDSRLGQRYRTAGAHPSRLAGDGASRALATTGRAGRCPTWISQARDSHPGGLQVQHLLAVLRAHICVRQHAGRGVSRRRDDAGRGARTGRATRPSITSRSFPSRRRSGICIMCSSSSSIRRWAKRRMARCWRPAIRARCR